MQRSADYGKLASEALKARENSYSPYSDFQVGAALMDAGGKIFTGCNIENAAYTPSNCAERTAVFKAVSEGIRDFKAIAVAGGKKGCSCPLNECPPCGVCLQVLMEFCDPETFEIILVRSQQEFRICLLKDLLPEGFGPDLLIKHSKL